MGGRKHREGHERRDAFDQIGQSTDTGCFRVRLALDPNQDLNTWNAGVARPNDLPLVPLQKVRICYHLVGEMLTDAMSPMHRDRLLVSLDICPFQSRAQLIHPGHRQSRESPY